MKTILIFSVFVSIISSGIFTREVYASIHVLRDVGHEFNEGPCKHRIVASKNLSFITAPEVIKVTLASQSLFRSYATVFLGRPPIDQTEVNRMCMRILFTDLTSTPVAYDNRVFVSLGRKLPDWSFDFTNVLAKSPAVLKPEPGEYIDIPVWSTENQLLNIRCSENSSDWKLLSRELPSPQIKELVLQLIEQLGFSRSLAWDMTETNEPCYAKTSPWPSLEATAISALEGFDAFSDTSVIYQPLKEPVSSANRPFYTLADFYKSFLNPISPFVRRILGACGNHGNQAQLGQQSKACSLFN